MALSDLPTLAEVQAARFGKPIPKGTTRLEEKTAEKKDDKSQLETWKKAVYHRDRNRCRVCGGKTVVTLELDPKRREAHHIVTRADKVVRYDRRNGLCCCKSCHDKFKKGLHVIATAAQMFKAENGKFYINGDLPVRFA